MITDGFLRAAIVRVLRQNWNPRKYSYFNQARPDNGFLLLLKGTMEYVIQGKTIVLKEGDLIFLPADSNYEVQFHTEKGPVEDLLINFTLPSEERSLPKMPTIVLKHCPNTIATIVERIEKEYTSGLLFLAQSDFFRLCHQIRSIEHDENKADGIIRAAKDLLSAQEKLSIEEIAAKLHICPSGLRKKFKDSTGISPIEFRLLKQIDRAKTLLSSTDLPIEEIASLCRFYDTAYFCKIFKKHSGVTPKAYRESEDRYL